MTDWEHTRDELGKAIFARVMTYRESQNRLTDESINGVVRHEVDYFLAILITQKSPKLPRRR